MSWPTSQSRAGTHSPLCCPSGRQRHAGEMEKTNQRDRVSLFQQSTRRSTACATRLDYITKSHISIFQYFFSFSFFLRHFSASSHGRTFFLLIFTFFSSVHFLSGGNLTTTPSCSIAKSALSSRLSPIAFFSVKLKDKTMCRRPSSRRTCAGHPVGLFFAASIWDLLFLVFFCFSIFYSVSFSFTCPQLN